MSKANPATASTRVAVEFVTLWMESDRRFAAEHIERVLNDPDGPGAASIIAGHCNLAMLLVLLLAKERNGPDENLRAKASEILRNLSLELPD